MKYYAKKEKFDRKKHLEKLAEMKRGKPSPLRGKKRNIHWSKESREKMSIRLKGRTPWNKGLRSKKYYEAEILRNSAEYTNFRLNVFCRDKYTCQVTGKRGGILNVHHLYSFTDYPELRFELSNGVTLSKEIHNKFHKIYGKKHNTAEQFFEFIKDYGGIKNA